MSIELKVGDRILNRWKIRKILRGGMGLVYVVDDPSWNREFAVKTFRSHLFSRSPDVVQRFEQEAALWTKLDPHPNVVQSEFVMVSGGIPLIFLEYVTGGDLVSWIGTPRLIGNLQQILLFCFQFCDGMIHVFSQGLWVHRDVKPQNCLIANDGTLKVTDFGLAKVFDENMPMRTQQDSSKAVGSLSVGLTRTGLAAGTCTHMAPEQFQDAKHVDVRSDIYSFGIMLFQMITGELPFMASTWKDFERLHKTQRQPKLGIRLFKLQDILETCLAKDPDNRFQNFAQVRDALDDAYKQLIAKPAPPQVFASPGNAIHWVNKATSFHQLGKLDEALACFSKANTINPNDYGLWFNKGGLLSDLGRHEEALTCFSRAIRIGGNMIETAWCAKACSLRALGKPEESLSCLDRALEINPSLVSAWRMRAYSLEDLRRLDEAVVCYERCLGLDPNDSKTWHSKGCVMMELKRVRDAIQCYDRALKIDPHYDKALFNKAVGLQYLGELESAIVFLNRALDISPSFQEAWRAMGAAQVGLGHLEEALGCYDRALKLNPKWEAALMEKGHVLIGLGRQQEALLCYNNVLELNPTNRDSWMDKGALLGNTGRVREAVSCFEEGGRLGHPQAEEAIRQCRQFLDRSRAEPAPAVDTEAEEYFTKGAALIQSERWQEAVECYDRIIGIHPDLHQPWFFKAMALSRLDQPDESIKCYERALSIKPDLLEAWLGMGGSLEGLNRIEEAVVCYDRVLRLNPQLAEVWHWRGSALRELGRLEEAVVSFDRALDLDPIDMNSLYYKGVALFYLRRLKKAMACLKQARKLGHPNTERLISICKQELGSD